MTETKIQMLYDNDDNPICPITSAKAVFDDDGRQITDLLGASALVNGDNLIIQNRGNGKDMKHKSGSFISAPDENGRVTVEVGFKPDFLKVTLPFDSGDTYAVYDSVIFKDKTYWWIPMENSTRYYTIPDLGNGETGIVEITDTGFVFRSHAGNTCNVRCTYEAIMFVPAEGGNSEPVLLFDNSEMKHNITENMILNDSYKNYKMLVINVSHAFSEFDLQYANTVLVKNLVDNNLTRFWICTYHAGNIISIIDDTTFVGTGSALLIYNIYGIK